jgi:predicted nucleotidyltransferase
MNLIETLHSKGLIKPPPFVVGGTCYLTITGSVAYGVSSDTSDMDCYGFCVPPKDIVFPHLAGVISGFGQQIQKFDQFQQHHIIEKDTRKEYDITVYSIIRFFQLCLENNPNMIDCLFTRDNCVITSTKISNHVRDNRRLFLHKGAWHKFKGYAYSQMHKMRIKSPEAGSTRLASVEKYGYDVKFAYHVVRLLNEVEQIMVEQDLDLMRNNEQLKAIRNGDWTMEQIEQYFHDKEKSLEEVYAKSTLRHGPDEPAIKKILLECLEEYYGSLDGAIETKDHYKQILRQIQKLVEKV